MKPPSFRRVRNRSRPLSSLKTERQPPVSHGFSADFDRPPEPAAAVLKAALLLHGEGHMAVINVPWYLTEEEGLD
jgi:hypothetical protein